jgi:hypothetical protein
VAQFLIGRFLFMRLRLLYGIFLMIAALTVYCLAAMLFAVYLLPRHWAAEIPFYLVAGIIWVWPAARMTRWMQDIPTRPQA